MSLPDTIDNVYMHHPTIIMANNVKYHSSCIDANTKVAVIVLDALDECSDQSLVADSLSVIFTHSKSLPVKFLITSWPEIKVKDLLLNHGLTQASFFMRLKRRL